MVEWYSSRFLLEAGPIRWCAARKAPCAARGLEKVALQRLDLRSESMLRAMEESWQHECERF